MNQTAAWRERSLSAGAPAVWSLTAILLLTAASPPLYACEDGTAVADPENNPGLVEDCKVLLGLRDELAGTGSLNWNPQLAMTRWHGIIISGSPSRVTLFVSDPRIPLTGTIPAELAQLSQMEVLDLYGNQLTGPIPTELGQLHQLTELALHNNQLTGPIPAELGQLTQLELLHLAENQLTGPIPVELGQLTQLGGLSLDGNQLTGPIPVELGQLSQMGYLDLGDNQLTGPIPAELGRLTQLEWLELRYNQLTGVIPIGVGQLSQLLYLRLDHNQLTGPVPAELGQLSRLMELRLDRNQLTGPIPAELGQLSQLNALHLQHNQLTGAIPAELGQVSRLSKFSFRGNRLSGPVPTSLNHLPDVYVLDLTARWVSPSQIKAIWDDPGDPTVSYEYWLSDGTPNQALTNLAEIEGLETTLRAGEGVMIECMLTGLPTDIDIVSITVIARNRNGPSPGASATVRPLQAAQPRLDFAHFANGTGITSSLVFVNVATPRRAGPFTLAGQLVRPTLYFYDKRGNPIAAESVVDVTGDLDVTEDGALTVQTAIESLGELTISTHGRGEVVTGSVKVVADGAIGGVLRFDLPGIGVAGVGTSQPVQDAIFPARYQAGGISTAAAIRNLSESELVVACRLMKEGMVLEEAEISLAPNGQESQYIEELFTLTDTSDFVGSVRCTAPPGEGMFTGVAVELDASNQIFTTLPVIPVER